MNSTRRATPELDALVALFYAAPEQLGEFAPIASAAMPPLYRRLLDHDEHMTVTVEAHHQSSVNVRVLESQSTATHYSRKILLQRQSDGAVVQFGLVRLSVSVLAPEVRREIESERIPLGRVLIQHNVLRNVRLLSLWRVTPGPDLCAHFGLSQPTDCYGRTALIYCNGVPAVELLEIVPPA